MILIVSPSWSPGSWRLSVEFKRCPSGAASTRKRSLKRFFLLFSSHHLHHSMEEILVHSGHLAEKHGGWWIWPTLSGWAAHNSGELVSVVLWQGPQAGIHMKAGMVECFLGIEYFVLLLPKQCGRLSGLVIVSFVVYCQTHLHLRACSEKTPILETKNTYAWRLSWWHGKQASSARLSWKAL